MIQIIQKTFDKTIEINPQDSHAWYNKGKALKGFGNDDESIKAYDKAIETDPQYSAAWDNKGNALTQLNQSYEAMKVS